MPSSAAADHHHHHRSSSSSSSSWSLPHWFVYVGWALVACAVGASSFFVFSYSIQWGPEKANAWLLSIVFSVLQSVLIVQPLKVLIVAAVVSYFCRREDASYVQSSGVDEQQAQHDALGLVDEHLRVAPPLAGRRLFKDPAPATSAGSATLDQLRARLRKEHEMSLLVRNILVYLVYLVLLLFLAQQNRNILAYRANANLRSVFVTPDFADIATPEDYWTWLNASFLDAMYCPTTLYNGHAAGLRDRPFTRDLVSFRLGAARVRQLRVRPGACKVERDMRGVVRECNVDYSWLKEDRRNFDGAWDRPLMLVKAPNATPARTTTTTTTRDPWRHHSMLALAGIPEWGHLNTYDGGGYFVDLMGGATWARSAVQSLRAAGWLDQYTRAIFTDLSTYNANVNLFSRASLLVEFSATGNAFTSFQINTFRLYSYVGAEATWFLICEIGILIFTLVFVKRIVQAIRKETSGFLLSFWNLLEVSRVGLSIAAMAMYATKNAFVLVALGDIAERAGGAFINFHKLTVWNETFAYLVGWVSFVSILQVLRLLRFNAHMTTLGQVLANSAKDLLHFSITFLLLFFAFCQFATLSFGPAFDAYRNLGATWQSLMAHLLGQMDFEAMADKKGAFGLTYYFVYVVIMSFLVLNMFFSILGNAFTKTQAEMSQMPVEYNLLEFLQASLADFWEGISGTLSCWDVCRRFSRKSAGEEDEEEEEEEEQDAAATATAASVALEKEEDDKEGRKMPGSNDDRDVVVVVGGRVLDEPRQQRRHHPMRESSNKTTTTTGSSDSSLPVVIVERPPTHYCSSNNNKSNKNNMSHASPRSRSLSPGLSSSSVLVKQMSITGPDDEHQDRTRMKHLLLLHHGVASDSLLLTPVGSPSTTTRRLLPPSSKSSSSSSSLGNTSSSSIRSRSLGCVYPAAPATAFTSSTPSSSHPPLPSMTMTGSSSSSSSSTRPPTLPLLSPCDGQPPSASRRGMALPVMSRSLTDLTVLLPVPPAATYVTYTPPALRAAAHYRRPDEASILMAGLKPLIVLDTATSISSNDDDDDDSQPPVTNPSGGADGYEEKQ